MNDGKILHWVPDTDMWNGHAALAAIAKKELGVNVDALKPGEFVLFMNHRFNAFKVYAANNMVLHHKSQDGARLNAKAVLQLPNFCARPAHQLRQGTCVHDPRRVR